ncbi:MAG: hypothetical protein KJ072_18430 [Verrucomicrobia bacterium]|nr:hypothetical protein [Verrucomicrobiota bacterium]
MNIALARSDFMGTASSYGMIIIAPPDAPQIAAPKPPPPPEPMRLDWIDKRVLDLVAESEPVKLWSALNWLAEEMSPKDRNAGRELRLTLLSKVLRLMSLKLLFRAGRNCVATFKRSCYPRPRRPRRPKRTVANTNSQKAVSAIIRATTVEQSRQVNQVRAEVVAASHSGHQPTPSEPKTESAPTANGVSDAARKLASLRRRPKIWSGWIGSIRAYRRMPIKLRSGELVFAFGVLRGHVAFTREVDGHIGDPDEVGKTWDVVQSDEVEVLKNQAGRLLGSLKSGVMEVKSEAKIRAARANGAKPCRPGKRRGRPTRIPTQPVALGMTPKAGKET